MRLSVSDKYPQIYRLATQRAQNRRHEGTCGLSPPNKVSTNKLKCDTLEFTVALSIRVLFCPVIYRQSSSLPASVT